MATISNKATVRARPLVWKSPEDRKAEVYRSFIWDSNYYFLLLFPDASDLRRF